MADQLDPRIAAEFRAALGGGVDAANERAAFAHLARRFTQGPELSKSLWGDSARQRESIIDWLRGEFRSGTGAGNEQLLDQLRHWYLEGPSGGQRGNPTYVARRLSVTETAFYMQAIDDAYDQELERAGIIDGYEILLSPDHDEVDECDEHAEGGPYDTLDETPAPPFHPFCNCRRRPIFLSEKERKRREKELRREAAKRMDKAGVYAATAIGSQVFARRAPRAALSFQRALTAWQLRLARARHRRNVRRRTSAAPTTPPATPPPTEPLLPPLEAPVDTPPPPLPPPPPPVHMPPPDIVDVPFVTAKELTKINKTFGELLAEGKLKPGAAITAAELTEVFDRHVRELLKHKIKTADKFQELILYPRSDETFTLQEILDEINKVRGPVRLIKKDELPLTLKASPPKPATTTANLAERRPIELRLRDVRGIADPELGLKTGEVIPHPDALYIPTQVVDDGDKWIVYYRESFTRHNPNPATSADLAAFAEGAHPAPTEEAWNRIFPMRPQELLEDLTSGLPLKEPPRMRLQETSRGISVNVRTEEFSATRHFRFDAENLVVDHTNFTVQLQHQGQGLGSLYARNSQRVYDAMGVTRVNLTATSAPPNYNGAYTWLRFGYTPTTTSWNSLRTSAYSPLVTAFTRDAEHLPPEQAQVIREALADPDPKAIWRIVDIPAAKPWFTQQRFTWEGGMSLEDEEALDRFYTYVNRIDAPPTPAPRNDDIIGSQALAAASERRGPLLLPEPTPHWETRTFFRENTPFGLMSNPAEDWDNLNAGRPADVHNTFRQHLPADLPNLLRLYRAESSGAGRVTLIWRLEGVDPDAFTTRATFTRHGSELQVLLEGVGLQEADHAVIKAFSSWAEQHNAILQIDPQVTSVTPLIRAGFTLDVTPRRLRETLTIMESNARANATADMHLLVANSDDIVRTDPKRRHDLALALSSTPAGRSILEGIHATTVGRGHERTLTLAVPHEELVRRLEDPAHTEALLREHEALAQRLTFAPYGSEEEQSLPFPQLDITPPGISSILADLEDEWSDAVRSDFEDYRASSSASIDVDAWNTAMGMTPAQLNAYVTAHLPDNLEAPRLHVSVDRYYIGLNWKADWGVMNRTITLDSDGKPESVSHDLMNLGGNSGSGTGKLLFDALVKLYDYWGIERIDVSAGLSAGGYAWLRYGFLPEYHADLLSNATERAGFDYRLAAEGAVDQDTDSIRDEAEIDADMDFESDIAAAEHDLEDAENALREYLDSTPAEDRDPDEVTQLELEVQAAIDARDDLVSDREQAVNDYYDQLRDDRIDMMMDDMQQDPSLAQQHLEDFWYQQGVHGDLDDPAIMWEIADSHLGKQILPGLNWSGYLDLQNPLQRDRLDAYIAAGVTWEERLQQRGATIEATEVHARINSRLEDLARIDPQSPLLQRLAGTALTAADRLAQNAGGGTEAAGTSSAAKQIAVFYPDAATPDHHAERRVALYQDRILYTPADILSQMRTTPAWSQHAERNISTSLTFGSDESSHDAVFTIRAEPPSPKPRHPDLLSRITIGQDGINVGVAYDLRANTPQHIADVISNTTHLARHLGLRRPDGGASLQRVRLGSGDSDDANPQAAAELANLLIRAGFTVERGEQLAAAIEQHFTPVADQYERGEDILRLARASTRRASLLLPRRLVDIPGFLEFLATPEAKRVRAETHMLLLHDPESQQQQLPTAPIRMRTIEETAAGVQHPGHGAPLFDVAALETISPAAASPSEWGTATERALRDITFYEQHVHPDESLRDGLLDPQNLGLLMPGRTVPMDVLSDRLRLVMPTPQGTTPRMYAGVGLEMEWSMQWEDATGAETRLHLGVAREGPNQHFLRATQLAGNLTPLEVARTALDAAQVTGATVIRVGVSALDAQTLIAAGFQPTSRSRDFMSLTNAIREHIEKYEEREGRPPTEEMRSLAPTLRNAGFVFTGENAVTLGESAAFQQLVEETTAWWLANDVITEPMTLDLELPLVMPGRRAQLERALATPDTRRGAARLRRAGTPSSSFAGAPAPEGVPLLNEEPNDVTTPEEAGLDLSAYQAVNIARETHGDIIINLTTSDGGQPDAYALQDQLRNAGWYEDLSPAEAATFDELLEDHEYGSAQGVNFHFQDEQGRPRHLTIVYAGEARGEMPVTPAEGTLTPRNDPSLRTGRWEVSSSVTGLLFHEVGHRYASEVLDADPSRLPAETAQELRSLAQEFYEYAFTTAYDSTAQEFDVDAVPSDYTLEHLEAAASDPSHAATLSALHELIAESFSGLMVDPEAFAREYPDLARLTTRAIQAAYRAWGRDEELQLPTPAQRQRSASKTALRPERPAPGSDYPPGYDYVEGVWPPDLERQARLQDQPAYPRSRVKGLPAFLFRRLPPSARRQRRAEPEGIPLEVEGGSDITTPEEAGIDLSAYRAVNIAREAHGDIVMNLSVQPHLAFNPAVMVQQLKDEGWLDHLQEGHRAALADVLPGFAGHATLGVNFAIPEDSGQLRHVTIVNANLIRAHGGTVTQRNDTLAPKSRASLSSTGRWTAGNSVMAFILHEVGHRYASEMLDGDESTRAGLYSADQWAELMSERDKWAKYAATVAYTEAAQVAHASKVPSDYALQTLQAGMASNDPMAKYAMMHELFAESFAGYMMDSKKFTQEYPELAALVESTVQVVYGLWGYDEQFEAPTPQERRQSAAATNLRPERPPFGTPAPEEPEAPPETEAQEAPARRFPRLPSLRRRREERRATPPAEAEPEPAPTPEEEAPAEPSRRRLRFPWARSDAISGQQAIARPQRVFHVAEKPAAHEYLDVRTPEDAGLPLEGISLLDTIRTHSPRGNPVHLTLGRTTGHDGRRLFQQLATAGAFARLSSGQLDDVQKILERRAERNVPAMNITSVDETTGEYLHTALIHTARILEELPLLEADRGLTPRADASLRTGRWSVSNSLAGVLLHELGHMLTMEVSSPLNLRPEAGTTAAKLLDLHTEALQYVNTKAVDLSTGLAVPRAVPSDYALLAVEEAIRSSRSPTSMLGELLTESFVGMALDSDSFSTDYPELADLTNRLLEATLEHWGEPAATWPAPGAVLEQLRGAALEAPRWELAAPPVLAPPEPEPVPDAPAVVEAPVWGEEEDSAADIARTESPEAAPTGLAFEPFFSALAGQFAQHIDNSIPNYAANRSATARAVMDVFGQAQVLDVGASEGQFGNLLALASDGKIRTVNVDPNIAMRNAWASMSPHEATSYEVAAWVEGFFDEDNDMQVPAFKADEPFDVAHMSMVRQFVTDDGDTWYGEARRNLKDDGVFLVNVKVVPSEEEKPEWNARESQKDEYKLQYFTEDEITQKAEETLVGMHQLMLTIGQEKAALRKHFKHVATYWESYNFYGFIASDDEQRVKDFLKAHAQRYEPDYPAFNPSKSSAWDFGPDKLEVLYHGTTIDAAVDIQDVGLVPMLGEHTLSAYQEYIDDGYAIEELVFLASASEPRGVFSAALSHVALKLGKSMQAVTRQEFLDHAALVVVRDYDPDLVLQLDEFDDTIKTLAGDDAYLDQQPLQVEPGDIFTREALSAADILTGQRLIDTLARHDETARALEQMPGQDEQPPSPQGGAEVPLESLPEEVQADIVSNVAEILPDFFPDEDFARGSLIGTEPSVTAITYETNVNRLLLSAGKRSHSYTAVKEYAQKLREDPTLEFDPILVHGGQFLDGIHRLRAYREAGRQFIPVVDIGHITSAPPALLRAYVDGDEDAILTPTTRVEAPTPDPEEVAASILEATLANEGATYSFNQHAFHAGGGFGVGHDTSEGRTIIVPVDEFRANGPEILAEFISRNKALLEHPDYYVGTWWENVPEKNISRVHLEPSQVIYDRAEAIRVAEERNQIAIFDFETFDLIDTGGTGEEATRAGAWEAPAFIRSESLTRHDIQHLGGEGLIDGGQLLRFPVAALEHNLRGVTPPSVEAGELLLVHYGARPHQSVITPADAPLGEASASRWWAPATAGLIPAEAGDYVHTATIPKAALHASKPGQEPWGEAELRAAGLSGWHTPSGQVFLLEETPAVYVGRHAPLPGEAAAGSTWAEQVLPPLLRGAAPPAPLEVEYRDGLWLPVAQEGALRQVLARGGGTILAVASGPQEALEGLLRSPTFPAKRGGLLGPTSPAEAVAALVYRAAGAHSGVDLPAVAFDGVAALQGITTPTGSTSFGRGRMGERVARGAHVVELGALLELVKAAARLLPERLQVAVTPAVAAAAVGYQAISVDGRYVIIDESVAEVPTEAVALISGDRDTLEEIRTTYPEVDFTYLRYEEVKK